MDERGYMVGGPYFELGEGKRQRERWREGWRGGGWRHLRADHNAAEQIRRHERVQRSKGIKSKGLVQLQRRGKRKEERRGEERRGEERRGEVRLTALTSSGSSELQPGL